jgi:hypothetical protein
VGQNPSFDAVLDIKPPNLRQNWHINVDALLYLGIILAASIKAPLGACISKEVTPIIKIYVKVYCCKCSCVENPYLISLGGENICYETV